MDQTVVLRCVGSQVLACVKTARAQQQFPADEVALVRRMRTQMWQLGQPARHAAHAPDTEMIRIAHHDVTHDHIRDDVLRHDMRKCIGNAVQACKEVVRIRNRT